MILPPPLGVSGISVNKLININETSFYLKKISAKYGRSRITCRAHYNAHYIIGLMKINVILGVEAGSHTIPTNMDGIIYNLRRWVHVTTDNYDQFLFGNFVNILLLNIEQHPAPHNINDEQVILSDNFLAHKTPDMF